MLEDKLQYLLAAGSGPAAPIKPVSDDKDDEKQEDETDETKDDAEEKDGDSAPTRVLAVFQRHPGKRVTVQSVVEELPDIKPSLVRTYASRHARNGKLKHVTRGVYKYVPKAEE